MSPILIVVAVVAVLALVVFFVTRGGGSATAGHHGPPALTWRVTKVTKETPSTVSLEVDGTMEFKAGQFVLLRPKPELPWRAYSFSHAPGDALRLTIKRVPEGQVSTYVTSTLLAGDALEVKGPYGQFVLPAPVKKAVFIAGGSGVTPFLSMLHEQAKLGWPTSVVMVNAHRQAAEQVLNAELEALVAGSGGKFELVQVLDDGANGAHRGPPSKDVLAGLLAGRETPDLVALCGPQPMMDGAREAALARWPGVSILEEKFSSAPESHGGAALDVELVMDGKTRTFPVHEGEHVLAAARAAKIGLSAGCEMGACGVCRVKVLAGDIDVPDDSCLSDDERAQGYRLVCVGKVSKPGCRFEPAP